MDRRKRRFLNIVLTLRVLCKECYHISIVYMFSYERAKRFKYARCGRLFPEKCGQGLRQCCNGLSSKGEGGGGGGGWGLVLLGLPSWGVLPCFSDLGPFLDLATIFLMHFHSSLENHTCLQSKMGKFCIHFQTKMAQKPYPLGRHIPTGIWLTQGSPPGTVFNFYQFLLMLAGKAKPVQCVLPHCTVYQHHC